MPFFLNDKINEFSERFTNFFTSRNVSYDDGDIDIDKNKNERFLVDIGYDFKKAIDVQRSRYRTKNIYKG